VVQLHVETVTSLPTSRRARLGATSDQRSVHSLGHKRGMARSSQCVFVSCAVIVRPKDARNALSRISILPVGASLCAIDCLGKQFPHSPFVCTLGTPVCTLDNLVRRMSCTLLTITVTHVYVQRFSRRICDKARPLTLRVTITRCSRVELLATIGRAEITLYLRRHIVQSHVNGLLRAEISCAHEFPCTTIPILLPTP
jgi:hypothetical protein